MCTVVVLHVYKCTIVVQTYKCTVFRMHANILIPTKGKQIEIVDFHYRKWWSQYYFYYKSTHIMVTIKFGEKPTSLTIFWWSITPGTNVKCLIIWSLVFREFTKMSKNFRFGGLVAAMGEYTKHRKMYCRFIFSLFSWLDFRFNIS